MINFQKDLYNYIQTNWFETVLISCVVFIIVYGLYLRFTNSQGTWSTSYDYNPAESYVKKTVKKKRPPPTVSKGEAECKRVLEKIFNKPFLNKTINKNYNSFLSKKLKSEYCFLWKVQQKNI